MMKSRTYSIGGLFTDAEFYYEELIDFLKYIKKGEEKTTLFHEDYCWKFCKTRPNPKLFFGKEEYWDKECFIKIAEYCYKNIVEYVEEIVAIIQEYTEEDCKDIIRKTIENVFKSRINEKLKEFGLVN